MLGLASIAQPRGARQANLPNVTSWWLSPTIDDKSGPEKETTYVRAPQMDQLAFANLLHTSK